MNENKVISIRRSRDSGRQRRSASVVHRLLALEPIWLLLLAPSLLWTEQLWDPVMRPFLILALFLFWPLRLKVGLPVLPTGAAGWFVGFLLIWIPITIWRAPASDVAWASAGYFYFALAFFLAATHWRLLQKKPVILVLPLLLLGTSLAIIGPESFSVDPDKMLNFYTVTDFEDPALSLRDTSLASGDRSRQGQLHPSGSNTDSDVTIVSALQQLLSQETINPNILAALLALLLPLGLALAVRWPWRHQGWRWLPLWPLLLLMGNALLLSQSRAAWLATLVALLCLGQLLWDSALRWPATRIILFYGGLFLVGASFVLLYLYPRLWYFGADSAVVESAWLSLQSRVEIWQLSLQLVLQNPLFGVGLGMYVPAFQNAFPTLPSFHGRAIPPHAHNLFIQLALDLGLPGLLAYLAFVAALVRSLLGVLQQQARGGRSIRLMVGVLAALVAMVTIGLVDNALWGTKLIFLPWSIFALAWLLIKAAGEQKEKASRR